MRGRLITLEGGEGVGKSTQARLLAAWLEGQGIDVIVTREPGGTPNAEAIRALLLEGDADRWTPVTEALLVAAARSDHVGRLIRPALDAGRWVICDRFLDSTLAYQGGAGGIAPDALLELHDLASGGLRPDLTLILMLPEAVGEARAAIRDGGKADRFGARGKDYHRKIAAAFEQRVRDEPERCVAIDASGETGAVAARIAERLAPLLP